MRHRALWSTLTVVCCVAAVLLPRPSIAQTPRTLEVRADSVLVDSAGKTIDARGHVRISDGRAVVTAQRAVYHVRERRVLLSGEVTMTSPDGVLRSREAVIFLSRANTLDSLDARSSVVGRSGSRTVRADRLIYAFPTARVTATGHVQISDPAGVATGNSLSADLRAKTGTLMGARIRSKDGTVAGDRLDIVGANRQAVFRGHVAAEFQTTKITSETATVFDVEKKAVFRGHVRIARPGRILLADAVTFYYRENRMVAEGQTRILIQETP